MNHNAGWQELMLGGESVMEGAVPSLEEALKVIEPPQIFRPNEVTAYSNYGANLAGYIVECIAGREFHEYVRENIFTPLGMDHTAMKNGWGDNEWVREQRYRLNCYTVDLQDLGSAEYHYELYASGNAVGTIADLRRFAQALLPDENGGSPLFQKRETLTEMASPTSYYSDGRTARNCHGLWVDPVFAGNVVGHSGNTAGCSSQLVLDYERGIGVVVMTNQEGEGIYCQDMVYGILGERNFTVEPVMDDPVTGYYVYSRTARKGMAASIGSIYVFRLTQEKDGTLSLHGLFAMLAGAGEMERVGAGLYRLDIAGQKMLLYARSDETGGIVALESSLAVDLIRTTAWEYYGNLSMILLFVLAFTYAMVSLILILVRTIRRKQRGNTVVRISMSLCIIASFINWVILFLHGMQMAGTVAGTRMQGMLFIALALISILMIAVQIYRGRRAEASKRERVGAAVNMAAGFIGTLFVIYWQLWMFWV